MSAAKIATSMKSFQVVKKLTDFRQATKLITGPVPKPGPNQLLVRNRFLGINASDINITAGRYDFFGEPPFTAGMEGMGEVVQIGEDCSVVTKVGQAVGYLSPGSFSEYTIIPEAAALPLPGVKREYLPLLLSGLTASLALDKVGEIKAGETVLVTAASGGTGQIAVQWAKTKGCHVIGTCSNEAKVDFLKKLGCDRVINLSTENMLAVLAAEYKEGINCVYESVGGEVFAAATMNLAPFGRLITIGAITSYQDENMSGGNPLSALQVMLIVKSSSVRGFMVFHYAPFYREYINQLVSLCEQGKIRATVDQGTNADTKFVGIETIPNAIEYLYSRKSQGKVTVELA